MAGLVFGRLTVLDYAPVNPKRAHWRCRCSCGNLVTVVGKNLRTGNTASCGCLKTELDAIRHVTHGDTVNGNIAREFRSWSAAKSRCYDASFSSFKHYGGRGIRMADEWRHNYAAFLSDMGRCPEGYSLDRIDTNGDYAPGNCRWATKIQQMNNTRTNRHLTYQGKRQTVAEWSRELGWPVHTLKRRVLLGWSDERALTQPIRHWPTSLK